MSVKLKLRELEQLAEEAGYASYKDMLYELYVVQGQSLHTIGARFHIYYARVRRHLVRFGIEIRGKGGPNNVKMDLTDDLLREVIANGVPATAERLGISITALNLQLDNYQARQKKLLT